MKEERKDLKHKWQHATRRSLQKKPGYGKTEEDYVKIVAGRVKDSYKGPKELPPNLPLQKDVKKYVPPTAHLWRCNKKGSWAGHLKPHCRVSSSWELAGSHYNALKAVLAMLWEDYLDDRCLPASSCPIKGVMAA